MTVFNKTVMHLVLCNELIRYQIMKSLLNIIVLNETVNRTDNPVAPMLKEIFSLSSKVLLL